MAGYTIHIAVAKIYEQYNEIKNIDSFERGVIAPDLTEDKIKSHYKSDLRIPDLNKYLRECTINGGFKDEFDEGYFLHLLTDYLFYSRLLEYWDERCYNDYDRLNDRIIKEYKLKLPEVISDKVKTKDGELEILNEEKTLRFINIVGSINVRELIGKKCIDFSKKMSEIDFEYKE